MSDEFKSADWAREALAKERALKRFAAAGESMLRPSSRPWVQLIPFEFGETERYEIEMISDEERAALRELNATLQRLHYTCVDPPILKPRTD